MHEMEANRPNLPQRVTRSNLCHDKCLLRLSIFSMMVSTIAMVIVSALYWIWMYRLPTATYNIILLISIVIIYVVSVFNSVVIILTIDQKEVYHVNRPTQGNVSSNVNDPQPGLVDKASSPIVHRVRFGDFTPPTNYAQEMTHSVSKRAVRPTKTSSSSTSKEEASCDYPRPDPERLNKSQLKAASSEMNEVVPPHQLLPSNSETVAKCSIQNESDISCEPRTYTSSQIEPIYEHLWLTRNLPLNIKSNVSKFQKSKVEKIDASQEMKKNGDFPELNNGQQIITHKKTPVRNISFQKSIAQRICLKRTAPDTGNIMPHSFASDSPISTSFAVASRETAQHPMSNSNLTSSSAVSPDRDHADSTHKSQLKAASSETNEVVPPHQLLPNNSETEAKCSIQNESDISRDSRTYTSSQIEPIYEHVWLTRNSPLNIKSNVSKLQKSKVEKIDASQEMKKNGDFPELNNGQQIITPKKTPVRNISFQKSIAQRIFLKRTAPDIGNIMPCSFASDSPLSTSFAVASRETSQQPFPNSNLTNSSAVSPNQDHADPSSASSRSTNRSIPLASSSNLYTPSPRRKIRSATNETSYSSVSTQTMNSRCEPQINETISKLQNSSKIQDHCTGTKETSFSSISPKTIISRRSEPQINSVIPKSTCSNLHTNIKREEICTSTSETFSSLSPKHHDNSSLVSSNQDYVNISPVSQLPRNRSFPSTSISSPYISSTTQEQRQPTILTSFSSVSPKTSTIHEISPVHSKVITTPYRMVPSYSKSALSGVSPQFSQNPRVLTNFKSEPHLFGDRFRVKYEPEKDEPDKISIHKRR